MAAGGNQIKSVMTLDVSNFETAVKKVSQDLTSLDTKMKNAAKSTDAMDKSAATANSGFASISKNLENLDKTLSSINSKMASFETNMSQGGKSTKTVAKSVETLSKNGKQSESTLSSMSEWVKKYGAALSTLNPLISNVGKSQSKLDSQLAQSGVADEKLTKTQIKNRVKALEKEKEANNESVKSRQKMLQELQRIETQASLTAAFAGKGAKRFFGKNASKGDDLRETQRLAEAEAKAARDQIKNLQAIVKEITHKNTEIGASINASIKELGELKKLEQADKKRIADQKALTEQKKLSAQADKDSAAAKKSAEKMVTSMSSGGYKPAGADWWTKQLKQQQIEQDRADRKAEASARKAAARAEKEARTAAYQARVKANAEIREATRAEKELARIERKKESELRKANAEAQRMAKKKADDEIREAKRVEKERLQSLRQMAAAERQQMREMSESWKSMTQVWTGAKVNQGVGGVINGASEMQQVEFRVKMLNMPDDQMKRFKAEAYNLSEEEKYLSNVESMQVRLDAVTAIGRNDEQIINKTLKSAVQVAQVLRSSGYETGSMSDLVKNLYGLAEARQVVNDPEEIIKTFEIILKSSQATNGKVKVADVETFARRAGNLRQTMNQDGWLGVIALMEQFKVAGGGNGGGGGVQTVGTMLKMLSLMGSGRNITNVAATQLLGADVLNDSEFTAELEYLKEGANTKEQFDERAALGKGLKNAGFKDVKSLMTDPVGFIMKLRPQLLEYMMQEGTRGTFFDDPNFTYDKKTEKMFGKDGKEVGEKDQAAVENAAFQRFFSRMGVSANSVDGFSTLTNKAFIHRSADVVKLAKNALDIEQSVTEMKKTWKTSIEEMVAGAHNLAAAFEPLLTPLATIPRLLGDFMNAAGDFARENPVASSIALGTVAVTGFIMTLKGMLGIVGRASGFLGIFARSTTVATASSGAFAAVMTKVFAGVGSVFARMAAFVGIGKIFSGAFGSAAAAAGAGFAKFAGMATKFLSGFVWVALAGMFGWIIGKWISDIDVGGIKVGERFQNMILAIDVWFKSWANGFLNFFTVLLDRIGISTANKMAELRKQREDYAKYEAGMKIRSTDVDTANNDITTTSREVEVKSRKVIEARKAKEQMDARVAENEKSKNSFGFSRYIITDSAKNAPNTAYLEALSQQRIALTNQRAAIDHRKSLLNKKVDAPAAADTAADTAAPVATPTNVTDPDRFGGKYIGDDAGKRDKKGFEERERENAFQTAFVGLKAKGESSLLEIADIHDRSVSYEKLSKIEFEKKWLAGDFDDGKNPEKRKFANKPYDKKNGWSEADLDWGATDKQTGISIRQYQDAWIEAEKQKDQKKAVVFAAQRSAASISDAATNYDQLTADTSGRTLAMTGLNREFARNEARNPQAVNSQEYREEKFEAKTNRATADYLEYAIQAKEQNKQLNIDLLETEKERQEASAQLAYDTEKTKLETVRRSLDTQIAVLEGAGRQETETYRVAIASRQEAEVHLTNFLANQEKIRLRATQSASQRQMAEWRDWKNVLDGDIANWTGNFADRLTDALTGQKKFDFREFAGEIFADMTKNSVRTGIGKLAKSALGNKSFGSVVKGVFAGDAIDGTGLLGKTLNKWRGKKVGDKSNNDPLFILRPMINKLKSIGEPLGHLFKNIGNSLSQTFGPAIREAGGFLKTMGASVFEATKGLWTFAGDAISKAISALGQWVMSLLTSQAAGGSGLASGLLSIGSAIAGAFMGPIGAGITGIGAVSTAAEVASMGSTATSIGLGGFSGAFANGGAFDSGIQAFADGGAFTNGLYDSPTVFKFANGGQFGVMGEAGPEAVMPLSRDGSGRLGVTVNGGAATGTTGAAGVMVSIAVNVDASGGSKESSSESGDANAYKEMADRIKGIVVKELVANQRPGGVLYRG